jgi:phospholipid/cholesterol/gamma-HCH transport system substrate-binding protein
METKANYAIVGFFTVVIMLAAFAFVFWMERIGGGGPMADLRIRIPGSTSGMSVGSPVRFNGIQVGAVQSLKIDTVDPRFAIATAIVDENTPIYESTKAVLELQGLTGAAYIELSGGRPGETHILKAAAEQGAVAVIVAEQSNITKLMANAETLMARADSTFKDVQEFVAEAREPLSNTVKNVEVFSDALAKNADGVEDFLASVGELSDTVSGLSGKLEGMVTSAERLLNAVDAEKVDSILTSADKVGKNLAKASEEVDELIASYGKVAERIESVGTQAEKTLGRVDKIVASADPETVKKAVEDASVMLADAREAVASFKSLAGGVEKRKESIDTMITNFAEMSEKLNKASTRVDGVLAQVDGLLGGGEDGEGSSLMADARETLLSIKQAADTLNKNIGPIANGLTRFTGKGLREVEALVGDTRRTVRNLESAISNFDNNPQRLIFGGDTVKTYGGRNRR